MDIDKIRDEMAKLEPGSPLTLVGEYMTARILAGATLTEHKTVKGAFEAIRGAASKKARHAGCVAMSDAEAWLAVDDYMGWPHETQATAEAAEPAPAPTTAKPEQAMVPPEKRRALSLDDLDALLEGL